MLTSEQIYNKKAFEVMAVQAAKEYARAKQLVYFSNTHKTDSIARDVWIVGVPQATKAMTQIELQRQGMIGLYRWVKILPDIATEEDLKLWRQDFSSYRKES